VFLLALLAAPASASAHALFGDNDPNRPLIDYLTLGFGHMVCGWDHLLFITGVVLLAGGLRSAAKLVSLFVLGHSLTLLVATLAGWKLNATLVDVVIALSLVYVGVQGIRGRPENFRVFGAVVFAFGLVHGLGLSTRLQDLGLPEDGIVGRVLLFNLGVELGQLVALTVIVGIGTLIVRGLRERRAVAARYAFAAIAASGFIAAVVISATSGEGGSDQDPVTAEQSKEDATACTQTASQPPPSLGGGHPTKQFFGPTEQAPEEDLGHVLGDGLVIVRYRPDLAPAHVTELAQLVSAPESQSFVIAAPDSEQDEPLRALTVQRGLTCSKPDMAGVTAFRDEWFAYVREERGG